MTRETWDRADWIATVSLCFVFPPIGIAALLRWLCGKRVWKAAIQGEDSNHAKD